MSLTSQPPEWEVKPSTPRERVRIRWSYPSPVGTMWCFQAGSHVPHQWTVSKLIRFLSLHRPDPRLSQFPKEHLTVIQTFAPFRGRFTLYRFGTIITFLLHDDIVTDDQNRVQILAADWKQIFGTSSSSFAERELAMESQLV